MLKHYAPDIDTYIIENINHKTDLSKSIIIDFNGVYLNLKDKLLEYYDIAPNGNVLKLKKLFSTLRNSEKNKRRIKF